MQPFNSKPRKSQQGIYPENRASKFVRDTVHEASIEMPLASIFALLFVGIALVSAGIIGGIEGTFASQRESSTVAKIHEAFVKEIRENCPTKTLKVYNQDIQSNAHTTLAKAKTTYDNALQNTGCSQADPSWKISKAIS